MDVFNFKKFEVVQTHSAMKVGTDAMILGAFIDSKNKKAGLDIGAGTGVLSLMVAQNNKEIKISGIEIDELSFKECQSNFQNCIWAKRMKAIKGDFIDFVSDSKYDLIFSNPPYYQTNLKSLNERQAQSKHIKGLSIEVFFSKCFDLLTQNGSLWVIVPFQDSDSWISEAKNSGLSVNQNIRVKGSQGGKDIRMILSFEKHSNSQIEKYLTIREASGSYTKEYISLTQDFHSKQL